MSKQVLEFRTGCHMADETRTLASITAQLRARDLELGRRDPAFARVVMTNDAVGQGEYACTVGGKPDTRPFTYTLNGDGTYVIMTPTYLPWQSADHTDPKATTDPDPKFRASAFAPPDIYAADLARLKTASAAVPESTFEERWKADRLAAVVATRRTLDVDEPKPRLTTAEITDFPPRDPYKADLDKMRSEGR